jgi:hypothetical protein
MLAGFRARFGQPNVVTIVWALVVGAGFAVTLVAKVPPWASLITSHRLPARWPGRFARQSVARARFGQLSGTFAAVPSSLNDDGSRSDLETSAAGLGACWSIGASSWSRFFARVHSG